MFDSLIRYTDGLENTAEVTRQFVRKLQGGVQRLSNSIERAEKEVKDARNERNYAAKIKEAYRREAIKLAKDTLFDATVNALKKTQEYDLPIFRKPLFEAIEDSDTYLYRPSGSGFNSILRIDIDLNRTAGRLNMWGTAIKRTRDELGVKIPSKHSTKEKRKKAALQASRAWAGIYNKRGTSGSKYMQTIKMRMENAARQGAFWELLDKGAVPFSSDRGGYPTPKNSSLNFVQKTEDEINIQLKTSFTKEKEKYDVLIGNYDRVLNEAYATLEEVSALVREISLDVSKISNLDKRADRALKAKTEEKLLKAINSIKTGLLTTRKLELAIKGSYQGRRFSNETLQELL